MDTERLQELEVGTHVQITDTFGWKWLEAEYGDAGRLCGRIQERTEPGVYVVRVDTKNAPNGSYTDLTVKRAELALMEEEDGA